MSIHDEMRDLNIKKWDNPPFMVQQHHSQQDEDEDAQNREDRVPNRKSPIHLISVWKVERCGLHLFHILGIKKQNNQINKKKHTKEFSWVSFKTVVAAVIRLFFKRATLLLIPTPRGQ